MDGSLEKTDTERGIYIHISTTFIVGDECSLLSHTQLFASSTLPNISRRATPIYII